MHILKSYTMGLHLHSICSPEHKKEEGEDLPGREDSSEMGRMRQGEE